MWCGFKQIFYQIGRHLGAVLVVDLIVDALDNFGVLDFKILLYTSVVPFLFALM